MEPNPLKRARERLGLSQSELAQALGMSRYSISRRETGEIPIPKAELLALEALEARAKLAEEIL